MHLFFYNLHFIIAILDDEENIIQFVYFENELLIIIINYYYDSLFIWILKTVCLHLNNIFF